MRVCYFLYFNVKIPDNYSYNITQSTDKNTLPLVELKLACGQKGMTQSFLSKDWAFASKPSIQVADKHVGIGEEVSFNDVIQGKTYDDVSLHPLSEGANYAIGLMV